MIHSNFSEICYLNSFFLNSVIFMQIVKNLMEKIVFGKNQCYAQEKQVKILVRETLEGH